VIPYPQARTRSRIRCACCPSRRPASCCTRCWRSRTRRRPSSCSRSTWRASCTCPTSTSRATRRARPRPPWRGRARETSWRLSLPCHKSLESSALSKISSSPPASPVQGAPATFMLPYYAHYTNVLRSTCDIVHCKQKDSAGLTRPHTRSCRRSGSCPAPAGDLPVAEPGAAARQVPAGGLAEAVPGVTDRLCCAAHARWTDLHLIMSHEHASRHFAVIGQLVCNM
jgi:hypothetical protein